MITKSGKHIAMLVFLLLLALSQSLSGDWLQSPEEKWKDVLISFKIFLADPVANFSEIEKINDLNYWTEIYWLVEGRNYVEELFSSQFQVSDIDENKLNTIFNLLLRYSINPNPYDGPMALIIDRLVEIMQKRPEWFVENLVNQPRWKEILRFISKKRKDEIKDLIIGLKNKAAKEEIIQYMSELENEKEEEYKWFEVFLKEPDKYAGQAKYIHNWGEIIGRYEQSHLDEENNLLPQNNPILILTKWISDGPDETKLKMLFMLLQNLTSGYHSELIGDEGAKIFIKHPQLFIRSLQDCKHWRYLLLRISYDVYYRIYIREANLEDIISQIGDSEFEKEVKKELEFLISLVKEKVKNIRPNQTGNQVICIIAMQRQLFLN